MRLQTLGLETFIWEYCNIRAKHLEVTHDYKNLIKTYTTVIYCIAVNRILQFCSRHEKQNKQKNKLRKLLS